MRYELAAIVCAILLSNAAAAERLTRDANHARMVVGLLLLLATLALTVKGLI